MTKSLLGDEANNNSANVLDKKEEEKIEPTRSFYGWFDMQPRCPKFLKANDDPEKYGKECERTQHYYEPQYKMKMRPILKNWRLRMDEVKVHTGYVLNKK